MRDLKFDKFGMAVIKPEGANPLEGIDFGVVERQLSYQWGDLMRPTSNRAIIREDNGQVLGIVGEDYVVHDHRPGILHAVETLRDLGDGRVSVKHTVNKFGGRIFTDVFLPTKGVGKGPEAVTPKFRFSSSYDGSKAVTVNMGVWRLVCQNGMGQWLSSDAFRRKHTVIVTAEDLARALDTVPEVYEKYQTLNKALTAEGIPNLETFGKGVGADTAKVIMAEHLPAEVANLGGTVNAWALFQASTRWATRAAVSEERREALFSKVEQFFLPMAGVNA